MPTLRAFECFVAVADTGSITEASRVLFLSQPAVSHQIGLLEREIGVSLFQREARGVRLTSAGRAALVDAQRAVRSAEASVSAARTAGEAEGGTLRIACGQSLISLIAPTIRHWYDTRPDVRISIVESTLREQLHQLLDDDAVDLVLMPSPVPERFTTTPVVLEEIVAIVPRHHVLDAATTIDLDDLDGVELVHYSDDNALGRWTDERFESAGVQPVIVMRTAVTAAAAQLAAAGLGVAVCPASAVTAIAPGLVHPFSPRWYRQLVAVTRNDADPLSAAFTHDLVTRSTDAQQIDRA